MAGIRDRPDPVEAIGVASARRIAGEADLVLFLAPADGGDAAAKQIAAWEKELTPKDFRRILTKADLGNPAWAEGWTTLSCKSGSGVDALRKLLADRVDAHVGDLNQEHAFVTSARQMAALDAAIQAITKFHDAVAQGQYEEMLAFELQQTVKALTSIVGDIGTEDLLDKIFSDFCVGK
jgi:tRNA modification GTPase